MDIDIDIDMDIDYDSFMTTNTNTISYTDRMSLSNGNNTTQSLSRTRSRSRKQSQPRMASISEIDSGDSSGVQMQMQNNTSIRPYSNETSRDSERMSITWDFEDFAPTRSSIISLSTTTINMDTMALDNQEIRNIDPQIIDEINEEEEEMVVEIDEIPEHEEITSEKNKKLEKNSKE